MKDERGVRPAKKATGNLPQIGIAQRDESGLLEGTIVIGDKQKTLLCVELIEKLVAPQGKASRLAVSKQP